MTGRGPAGLVRRDLVDHALARRALLQQLFGGGLFVSVSLDDVCDASPYLLRAATAYGVLTERTCPLCRRQQLHEVTWVYGESIGPASGSARTPAQLARLAAERPDFSVHEVEVCTRCRWNHLLRSWRAGTPGMPKARRHRTDEPGHLD
ncbi:MAG: hypothetical protein JWO60_2103 [Frankiales bacterium]|nr:hypothetical protein [Frankiales bacterium]